MRFTSFVLGVCAVLSVVSAEGASPAPLSIQEFSRSNSTVRLSWTPLPAIESYEVLSASSPVDAFERQLQGVFNNFTWSGNSDAGAGFYKLVAQPLSDEALYAANALNRIAYGPTPDELDRILTGANPTGAQGFINEQLAPELIQETLDTDPPISGWVFNTVSGPIESARLYIYLDGPGSVLIDDIKLVAGAEPGVGANLLQNGGFESALSPRWVATANFTNSSQVTGGAKEGTRMLQLTATAAGSGNGNALYQNFSGVQAGQVYTLSYWHFTTNLNRTLTIRCSGSTSLRSEHAVSPARPPVAQIHSELLSRNVNLAGLRSWFVQHAVYSKRQLLEVMSQFWENHFVTEHSKTVDYFDRYYDDFDQIDRIAADLEFRELTRWRDTMMKPTGTFRDLLRISAESPAQIIYLDTVDSRGDGRYIANENYARELLELYTFGVDNGYDQADIVTMSRAWTGWTVRLKDEVNINNPFAPQTTNILDTTITNLAQLGAISNLVGVWTLHFRNSRHATAAKTIFPGKRVPARFGAPWANRLYELRLPARSGDPGMQDGYDVINHLSDQPFTQEYISVKLCRLLVHEDFHHGEYDYRDPNLSEEGKLVHKCMQAWENGSPKGQLRQVLRVILESDLFKKQPGSMQKIKTPIEFCASAIRAIRSDLGNGRSSSTTDGRSIVGSSRTASSSPLVRMGTMRLFSRMEPDGYPEAGAGWISGGTLAERSHFIQAFLMAVSDTGKRDDMSVPNQNYSDPSGLIRRKLPQAQWTDADAIVTYLLRTVFPAEGLGNLQGYRTTLVRFLNTADNGVSSSPFRLLAPGTAAYDTRVRGMVSLLMMSPRFQEQ